ncbi:LPXTG cell wall anchor domain-containing protein [Listeria sp. FSL L7-0233]|uniref:LPXTG cell wall anchor domain-containing protein n=1 Tax=Listeria cossartiae TaxID=2838249 RepID=UPI0016259C99|nr:LPXTG cell wall anchor domain-containing protein [Listeria cossartiae]MBC2182751.1 LPXTG cell wall anchor domain-containing protein [Listeria cossartiae subsp. cossartiae]MBC2191046.1 LPXTG cell wall anchor domain-containing protein [Listeria cossartiae subsp. cossartiae]
MVIGKLVIAREAVDFTVKIVKAEQAAIVVAENPGVTPKPKREEELVIRKLPLTGDTTSKAIFVGLLCLGTWLLVRKK